MTRIAAGTGGQPSIDNPLAHAAGGAREPDAAAGGVARLRSGDGADQPAPLGGVGNARGAADASAFLTDIKGWEGEHPNLYVDTRGYVTTGIGHLLKTADDAAKLPWLHSGTGRAATAAEVKAAFTRVAQAGA